MRARAPAPLLAFKHESSRLKVLTLTPGHNPPPKSVFLHFQDSDNSSHSPPVPACLCTCPTFEGFPYFNPLTFFCAPRQGGREGKEKKNRHIAYLPDPVSPAEVATQTCYITGWRGRENTADSKNVCLLFIFLFQPPHQIKMQRKPIFIYLYVPGQMNTNESSIITCDFHTGQTASLRMVYSF